MHIIKLRKIFYFDSIYTGVRKTKGTKDVSAQIQILIMSDQKNCHIISCIKLALPYITDSVCEVTAKTQMVTNVTNNARNQHVIYFFRLIIFLKLPSFGDSNVNSP